MAESSNVLSSQSRNPFLHQDFSVWEIGRSAGTEPCPIRPLHGPPGPCERFAFLGVRPARLPLRGVTGKEAWAGRSDWIPKRG